MHRPRSDLSRFAVITTVFNPVRYRTRYERYRQFAYHMARSGVNLYTIECVFESATRFGLPPQRFEVTRPDNPQHFQVVAPSIIWMKENLINIVVQQLPPHIDRIAWIDADVEFEVDSLSVHRIVFFCLCSVSIGLCWPWLLSIGIRSFSCSRWCTSLVQVGSTKC